MEFFVTKVEEKGQKETYIKDLGQSFSDDLMKELIFSDFWVVLSEDKCFGFATAVENNDISIRISHFFINRELLETDVAIFLYMEIEKYYVNKNFEMMLIKIPANVRGLTGPMRKFFKRVGLRSELKEIGYEGNFILLIKDDLKKWYTEKNGELIPNIIPNK